MSTTTYTLTFSGCKVMTRIAADNIQNETKVRAAQSILDDMDPATTSLADVVRTVDDCAAFLSS